MGTVKPEHISAAGDFKLQLVSHDVAERGMKEQKFEEGMQAVTKRRTGYAWFNYAVLTPVPVEGRINVNSASRRLLRSLPGVDDQLAASIWGGIDAGGKATLKPYLRLGDLLRVQGMTMDIFARLANMVMLNSYAYTVEVEAQAVKDANANGIFDEAAGDVVVAGKRMRYVIAATPNETGIDTLSVVEQMRP